MGIALPALSLAQLQKLALRCGIARSGTKKLLERRLLDHLQSYKPLAQDARVLSIDLGIRNLAYSLLSPAPAESRRGSASKEKRQAPSRLVVHAWNRLSLTEKRELQQAHEPLEDATESTSVETEASDGARASEFSPASLSGLAVSLVQDQLLALRPTHVLLERQRFRSGGGAAVLEWTVRVNSLEAMLYAVFSTLKALGHWDGILLPIEPKRVGAYFLDDSENGRDVPEALSRTKTGTVAKSSRAENKRQKIDLVGTWLSTGTGVELADQDARDVAALYLDRWKGDSRRKSSNATQAASQKLKKLDDLADSLLQGSAWFRWQENTARARKGQIEDLIG